MMRLGLIARADSRGLGVQTKAFHDHLHPTKTMVVNPSSAKPLALHRDWYPGATWVDGFPTSEDFVSFLEDLDVVYTAELPYDYSLFTLAAERGIRTLLHVNPEFCDKLADPTLPDPTLYLAPTTWLWDRLPDPKKLLPFPVDTEKFRPAPPAHTATRFLHVVGRPAIYDRNGTGDFLLALENVRSEIEVFIRCQQPGYVHSLICTYDIHLPDNVNLRFNGKNQENYWDLYGDQDVLVMPRRFAGMSLPMQEACAAGLPVIAPDISPNNDWLSPEWLVPARRTGSFTARTEVDVYTVDHIALAAMIDRMATDSGFYQRAARAALSIADQRSWKTLLPEYLSVLSG